MFSPSPYIYIYLFGEMFFPARWKLKPTRTIDQLMGIELVYSLKIDDLIGSLGVTVIKP